MLAVIWAIEHYHVYLYGAKFTVITDHKPLLGIFTSQKLTSARIDRWKLRQLATIGLIPKVKPSLNVKDKLSVYNGLILRNHRLVLPHSLQNKAVHLAHTGHQGIVKTKMLLRKKVWFPSKRQVSGRKSQDISSLPSSNYRYLRQTFPSGELLLVVIDEFSRFPEVEIINSTSAKTVIPKLDDIFFRQGVPCVLKTDNGPPFDSSEFEQFAKYLGFKHRRVTPYWPKANGEAERFMRTLGKAIRTAYLKIRIGNKLKLFQSILLKYRNFIATL